MPARIDVEIGSVFGRLTVLEELPKSGRPATMANHRYFACVCSCGQHTLAAMAHLRSGHTQSCGCYNRDVNTARGLGRNLTRVEYKAWQAIKQRCYNEKTRQYADYGGRGIGMCDRWRNSFDTFLSDMGRCPRGHTIERVNNDGDYCPENCVWATRKTQSRNTRRNRLITYKGKTMCVAAWSEYLNLSVSAFIKRLNSWPIDRVFSTPVSHRHITNRK